MVIGHLLFCLAEAGSWTDWLAALSNKLYQITPPRHGCRDLFEKKKGILFGVPGAFTPGCSKTHLPGYVGKSAALKEAGAEVNLATNRCRRSCVLSLYGSCSPGFNDYPLCAQVVACVTVNDAFVAQAWADANGAGGKARAARCPLQPES